VRMSPPKSKLTSCASTCVNRASSSSGDMLGLQSLMQRSRRRAEELRRRSLVDERYVELTEPRRIADDLERGCLAVRDREAERSPQTTLRRHDDTDGAIHQRELRELHEVPVGDRPLGPRGRASDLARRRAGHVRANDEIRIE